MTGTLWFVARLPWVWAFLGPRALACRVIITNPHAAPAAFRGVVKICGGFAGLVGGGSSAVFTANLSASTFTNSRGIEAVILGGSSAALAAFGAKVGGRWGASAALTHGLVGVANWLVPKSLKDPLPYTAWREGPFTWGSTSHKDYLEGWWVDNPSGGRHELVWALSWVFPLAVIGLVPKRPGSVVLGGRHDPRLSSLGGFEDLGRVKVRRAVVLPRVNLVSLCALEGLGRVSTWGDTLVPQAAPEILWSKRSFGSGLEG